MTLPEARACCASLDVKLWDDDAIADAILAMTTLLLAASPQVTPVSGAPGMWWVGASGFGALGGEDALARALLALAQTWHPDARVSIADSCVAARAATWAPRTRRRATGDQTDSVTIVPVGGCATYLAPAPLGLVPMDDELRDALRALGLRTVGALAALDAGDVERRWSASGLTAWRLSRGDDPRRPGLVRVEASRTASVELPAPAETTAPVLFVMRALLERLVRELVDDGRAAASVAITLVLDAGRQWPLDNSDNATSNHDMGYVSPTLPSPFTAAPQPELLSVPHRTITREVRPARAVARVEPLFDQYRSLLEQWTIPAPIIGVTLSIPATAPLAADQGDLLVPSWRDAAMHADAVFTRLRAVLDPNGVGDVVVHPVAGDAHRPEAAGVWERADAMRLGAVPVPMLAPSVSSPSASASIVTSTVRSTITSTESASTPAASISAVLRLLDTAERVDVEEANGCPDAVWWRGRRLAFASVDGPERLSGDWWRADAFARDYWRCAVVSEGELLLYREAVQGAEPKWYVQGWYD